MTSAVEQADRAPESNVVAEDIAPHELVYDNVGTGLELLDGDETTWHGIAMQHESGSWVHDHDEDADSLVYQSSENDRASYGGAEDGAVIRPHTVKDGGSSAAPSISEGDIVVVPDTTTTNAPASFAGRVVEDGYTNDETDDATANATTYSIANSNVIPIGRAVDNGNEDGDPITSFDAEIRVKVDKSL